MPTAFVFHHYASAVGTNDLGALGFNPMRLYNVFVISNPQSHNLRRIPHQTPSAFAGIRL